RLRRSGARAAPLDRLAERCLPALDVAAHRMAARPPVAALRELPALARVVDQAHERGMPLVVRHEPPALALAEAEVGADRRGEPRRPDGGVLLQLAVRARLVERDVCERGDADVPF